MTRPATKKIINNNKTMKRELIFPTIIGIIIGVLIMVFWQFSARLITASNAIAQLEQATAQNTTTINQVVSFINQATGVTGGEGAAE
jgi:amino acid permease